MDRLQRYMDKLFTRRRWLIHVFFWTLVLALYSVFFGRQNNNFLQTVFFIGFLMPVTIASAYFVNYFLVPRFLIREKYALFALYFVYTLVISVFLEMIVMIFTFIFMAEVRISNMSPASIDTVFLLTSLSMVVCLALAIKLLLHWRTSKEEYQKLMRDKVETELKFLKAQLNPHFLFNTLNNLYYLTTEKSDRAPEAVLQLSQMLDYVMRGTREVFVPLQTEWEQMQNYVALESLRYADRLKVETKFTEDKNGYTIAPMLLVTLVENAFKHGVMNFSGNSWIRISVDCKDDIIRIAVTNKRLQLSSKNGIGLANLQNQLQLLYPSQHDLCVSSEDPNEFKVELTLALKNEVQVSGR